ncbi:hypothetical protein [Pseudanabaena sp. lw0831]|uniref:hypothetical protein n=1 Tax=Pseudanabaena sp. lw0831 TaxID=1357935 RepID=UPI0019155189|nr:hypothetical protein [Pseudanabaena sp. lw0831]
MKNTKMPEFTAEKSLYKTSGQYQSNKIIQNNSSGLEVLPQLQRVRCAFSGRSICCGVEDDTSGTSFPLGCGRIL